MKSKKWIAVLSAGTILATSVFATTAEAKVNTESSVTEEMCDVSFWQSRNAYGDTVLMTSEQIEKLILQL